MGAVIGIDLGTTNTVIATVRDGRPVALPDELGSTLIPSIVSFLPSGAVLVGNTARERRAQDVRNTIYSVKRLIGRTWDSPEVSQTAARFPFELREGPGRSTFVLARGETYTLPEISAFVLRKAKSIAELELGEPIERAVITVPANFNELQRAATKVAGRVAGLEVLRIINEPTAAALAFGHTHGNATRLAVYDFGGGTFDFTLLRLTDDVFEVLATAGDTFLGGDDIDAEIVERMADRFIAEGCTDPREVAEGLERLRDAGEQLKLRLSSEPDASVRLDELGIDGAPAVEFLLTRRDLDSISRPIVERTFAICRDALSAAKLDAKAMDDVLLVGGSTKDPYVRKRVGEFFGRPARCDVDPHEVVALGAAQYAWTLSERGEAASEVAVPPPPMPALPLVQPPAEASFDADAFRPKTQPFGRMAPAQAPAVTRPAGAALGSPAEPASKGAASTQDLARRRTTGIGMGPAQAAPAEWGMPQPPSGSATSIPDTLPGPEQKLIHQEDLPAAKSPPPREPRRGPTVRVAAGVPPARSSAPDLTQTLSSPGTLGSPAASKQRGPVTERFGFSLVQPTDKTNAPLPPTAAAQTGSTTGPVDVSDSWSDLPEPISRPPSSNKGFEPRRGGRNPPPDSSGAPDLPLIVAGSQTTNEAARTSESNRRPLPEAAPSAKTTLLAERPAIAPKVGPSATDLDKSWVDESALPTLPGDEDEPTVIRRSRQDLADEQEVATPPSPEKPPQRPGSLNEAEIRARYGNLPLIVGGKRVGANAQRAPSEPSVTENLEQPAGVSLPAVPTPSKPPGEAAQSLDLPSRAVGGLARQRTEFSPGLPTAKQPPSLEPQPIELEDIEPISSRPKPGRILSSRPAARQDAEMEAELPIPEVPPSSSRASQFQFAPALTAPIAPALTAPIAPTLTAPIAPTLTAPIAPPRGPRTTGGTPFADTLSHATNQASPPRRVPTGPSAPQSPPGQWIPSGGLNATQPLSLGSPQTAVPGAAQTAAFAAPSAPAASAPAASAPTTPFTRSDFATGAIQGAAATSLLGAPVQKRLGAPSLLIDVTPLSLCVETAGGYADILVSRNTPVPCEHTRDFVTAQDNQQTVVVRVAQGESGTFRENVLLGEVQLTGISEAPRGTTRIAVTFGLDSDGMLHVRALDVATGRDATVEFQLVGAPTSPEVQQMMARHLSKGGPAGLL